MLEQCLDSIVWTSEGLVPVITQEVGTGKILMFAWMSRESLEQTIQSGRAVYWSRSRQRLWKKGEQSGNEQVVKSIRLDCDGDAVLLEVEQQGGVACHTGRQSCFYRQWSGGRWVEIEPVLRDPADMYKPD